MSNTLYSERLTWKYFFMDLICIPAYVFLLYGLVTSPFNAGALIIMNLIGFAILIFYLNFRVLRVKVTEEYIEASYGIFLKRLPLNTIKSIIVQKYRFRDVLGWGIRMNLKGELAYNILGDNYTGVLIEYVDKNNKSKKIFISSKTPYQIVEIVNANRF